LSAMRFYSIFIIAIILPLTVTAQKVKIISVPEPNLFELDSGEHVRLANVRLPNPLYPDSGLHALDRFIQRTIKKYYINKWFEIHYSDFADSSGYPLVHLSQKYPLNTFYLNQYYLQKGYGWYVDNADSLHQEKYKRAAQEAKKYKRGVWNSQQYLPPGLGMYSLSFLAGYLEPDEWEPRTVLNDYTLRFAAAEHRSGLELTANLFTERKTGCLCCECGSYSDYVCPTHTKTFAGYAFSVKAHMVGYLWGFSMGGTYVNVADTYCNESGDYWLLPNLEIKLGLMQKIYLSYSFVDWYRQSLYTIGIHYIFRNPLNRIWLGYSSLDENTRYGFEGQFNPLRNVLVFIQGSYFKEYQNKRLGGRVGFGFVLR